MQDVRRCHNQGLYNQLLYVQWLRQKNENASQNKFTRMEIRPGLTNSTLAKFPQLYGTRPRPLLWLHCTPLLPCSWPSGRACRLRAPGANCSLLLEHSSRYSHARPWYSGRPSLTLESKVAAAIPYCTTSYNVESADLFPFLWGPCPCAYASSCHLGEAHKYLWISKIKVDKCGFYLS